MKTRTKVAIGVGLVALIGGGLYLKSLGTKVIVSGREYRVKRAANSLLITNPAGDTIGVIGGQVLSVPANPTSHQQMSSDIMTNPADFGLTLEDLALLNLLPAAVAGRLYAR